MDYTIEYARQRSTFGKPLIAHQAIQFILAEASTLGVLYAVTDDPQADALQSALRGAGRTPLAALSMMLFVLLYLPCLATVATIRREAGSVNWMLFSIVYSTSLAWVVAFVVYQGGCWLGFARSTPARQPICQSPVARLPVVFTISRQTFIAILRDGRRLPANSRRRRPGRSL
ncbi:MAG: nucleoside recognition domain-containing protein [Desulfobacterales bacterium]|jgi:hypothetical protein